MFTLEIIQAAMLVFIAALAFHLRRPAAPAPAPVVFEAPKEPAPAPAAVRSDLAQVLIARDGGWHHHSWAQAGSDAYREALRCPGYAIRDHGTAEIQYGRQA